MNEKILYIFPVDLCRCDIFLHFRSVEIYTIVLLGGSCNT